MSPPSIKDQVLDYLRTHPGTTNGSVIAAAIGRPRSYSTVYRILRELQGKPPTAAAAHPGTGGGSEGSLPRGETRRRIEEYLDGHPGVELNSIQMAQELGLNPSTVGKNMRAIIRERSGSAKAAGKPKTGAQLATRRTAPAEPAGNGVTALLLKLQASNFADVPLPPNVLIRQPGGPHHRDGIARDADGRIYELREL